MRIKFTKVLILMAAIIATNVRAFAYDFEYDGLGFNILSQEERTVEVVKNPNLDKYIVNVPEKVVHLGTEYTVTAIGAEAFKDRFNLYAVKIPASVISVGDKAFYNNTDLRLIECDAEVPPVCGETVFTIEPKAALYVPFRSVSAYKAASQWKDLNVKDTFSKNNAEGVAIYYSVIPDDNRKIVEVIANPLGYKGSVNIPEKVTYLDVEYSVTAIGESAFRPAQLLCSELTALTIPESVTTIKMDAFAYCNLLEELTIPESVTSIESGAFQSCTKLARTNIPNQLTVINDNLFKNCSSLSEITIPISVTLIGRAAFYYCKKFKRVVLPQNISIIADQTFGHCGGLEEITIPESVTSIGDDVFRDCTSLTQITIPKRVTTIGEMAFYKCTGLTEITISGSVTTMGFYAFYGCSGLTKITSLAATPPELDDVFYGVPKGIPLYVPFGTVSVYKSTDEWKNFAVTCIENEFAEKNADGVTIYYRGISDENRTIEVMASPAGYTGEVNIPETVTHNDVELTVIKIGAEAFRDQAGMTAVRIPSSVAEIGANAFNGCSGLSLITCDAEVPPTCGTAVFTGVNTSTTILDVPENTKALYAVADQWKDFINITKEIEIIDDNAIEVERYDISGHKLTRSTAGVNIVRYSNGVVKKETRTY